MNRPPEADYRYPGANDGIQMLHVPQHPVSPYRDLNNDYENDGHSGDISSASSANNYHHVGSFYHQPPPQISSFQDQLLQTKNHSDVKVEAQNPTHLVVSRWPQAPITLHRPVKMTIFSLTGDVILLFIWIALVIFAVAVARSNGESRENVIFGQSLDQASIIIPTFFPIFFAATVGRCIKLISLYRVEQGERLGVLDRLVGSTTMMGTLITAMTMWSASVLTIILFIIWALSPLGGQASTRAFHWEANMTTTPVSFAYLSSNNTWNIPGPSSDRVYYISPPNSMFLSTLVSPQDSTDQPMDLWGNVKIPSIEAVAKTKTLGQDGWYDLGNGTNLTTADYSSLIGVPVRRSDAYNASSRWNLETSYWTLDCPKVGQLSVLNAQSGRNISNAGLYWEGDQDVRFNYSEKAIFNIYSYRDRNISLSMRSPDLKPRRIVFLMADWYTTVADCFIQTTYVETQVTCRQKSCAATKIRSSTKPNLPSRNYTGLDDELLKNPPGGSPYFEDLASSIPGRLAYPSVLTTYLGRMLGIDTQIGTAGGGGVRDFGNQSSTRIPEFSFFLSQVLNTYWIASSGANYVLDPSGADYSFYPGVPAWAQSESSQIKINFENTTEGVFWTEEPVFICSNPWLALLFVAILVPLVACLMNVGLAAYFIRGPHLAMNFSTMTRDNPYVGVPAGGSALSDETRGNRLRNVWVRFGDVKDSDEVGHLALGIVDDGQGGGTRRLGGDKGRLYE
ncbi:hypothetical protein QBC43DRAFT_93552 [Cladorrhinum sp. PSN259]|nr:hypothetical protein QBC43DRAFT_93552 [Cladorrhinum sp. PSN259]